LNVPGNPDEEMKLREHPVENAAHRKEIKQQIQEDEQRERREEGGVSNPGILMWQRDEENGEMRIHDHHKWDGEEYQIHEKWQIHQKKFLKREIQKPPLSNPSGLPWLNSIH
jgi:hypothetical protein